MSSKLNMFMTPEQFAHMNAIILTPWTLVAHIENVRRGLPRRWGIECLLSWLRVCTAEDWPLKATPALRLFFLLALMPASEYVLDQTHGSDDSKKEELLKTSEGCKYLIELKITTRFKLDHRWLELEPYKEIVSQMEKAKAEGSDEHQEWLQLIGLLESYFHCASRAIVAKRKNMEIT
jgi:hypothetical protein